MREGTNTGEEYVWCNMTGLPLVDCCSPKSGGAADALIKGNMGSDYQGSSM